MMTPMKQYYENLAQTTIKNLKRRGFEACYVPDGQAALEICKGLLTEGKTAAIGGSMTAEEIGLMDYLKNPEAPFTFYDRYSAVTQEEKDALFSKISICDYYFMSSNAITTDGQLVNIDGTGNRLASLIHGPRHVVIIAGMNKVCPDVEAAYKRVIFTASPPNCVRLNRKTPCAATGVCGDCLSPDCICTHTVITRRSNIPGRISIILVGEDLGY